MCVIQSIHCIMISTRHVCMMQHWHNCRCKFDLIILNFLKVNQITRWNLQFCPNLTIYAKLVLLQLSCQTRYVIIMLNINKEKLLTVRFLIPSPTVLILLNRINNVVNDFSWYTTSGIWKSNIEFNYTLKEYTLVWTLHISDINHEEIHLSFLE